jgi:type IV pilus assembly protein PilA
MAMQPPYPQQAPPQKKGMSTCLIVALVVGAIGLFIGVILLSLSFYGVRKYLAAAKTAEAKNTVGAITRAAVAAYEYETPGSSVHRLCKSSTYVPVKIPAGVKYQPSSAPGVDFNAGNAGTGWPCLKFSITQPIYYQYSYVTGVGTGKSGATPAGFEASARGDLDGNGATSLFARGADVRNGQVVVSDQIYIENEFE